MKKIKSILAFALALSMCTSMAACGSSDDDSDDKSDNKTTSSAAAKADDESKASDETASSDESTAEDPAAEEPEDSSETEQDDDASKYGYYEDLAAEYEANGFSQAEVTDGEFMTWRNDSSSHDMERVYYKNGKLYFGLVKDDISYIMCYDINTKKTTERQVDFYLSDIDVAYGKILYVNSKNCTVIDLEDDSKSYTVDFSESNVSRPDYYKCHVLSSGAVVGYDEEDNVIYYYSQETGEVNYPGLTVKDSHGLEQKVSADLVASYGNKLYFEVNGNDEGDKLYCFDLDSKQWGEEPVLSGKNSSITVTGVIGKYMFLAYNGYNLQQDKLYNMETDEVVGTFSYPEDYFPKYFGGDSHIYADHESGTHYDIERFKKVKLPIDGSPVDENATVDLYSSDTTASIFPVNETYYLFIDNAGIFLRSYDKGPDGEEIVCVFDN